ncbi:MAG: TonB family protein [Desulfobacula sp.]|nr:TonB family protein [Desulfobacula sp.]
MSSQDKIFHIPGDSLFNSGNHGRNIGILFIIISVFAHGLFFFSLIFFQDFKLPKSMPPVIQIDLVSFAPEPVLEDSAKKEVESSKGGVTIKKAVIKKKQRQIPTIKPDISLKTKPKNLKALIASKKKKITKKKEKKPVKKVKPKKEVDPDKALKKARDELEKKVEDQNQERLAQALQRLQKKVKGQGTQQNSGDENAKKGYKPIDLYKMVLGSAIEQNWVFSDVLARMDQNLEVRILVKILKSGVIRDIIYETRSGNRYLDESAKKAIKKANPLPQLPAGRHSYDVIVIFTPKGLK